jgi:hypothetical protein
LSVLDTGVIFSASIPTENMVTLLRNAAIRRTRSPDRFLNTKAVAGAIVEAQSARAYKLPVSANIQGSKYKNGIWRWKQAKANPSLRRDTRFTGKFLDFPGFATLDMTRNSRKRALSATLAFSN